MAVGDGVAVGALVAVGSGASVIDPVNVAQPAVSTSATTNPVAQKVRLSDITASHRRTVLIHPTEFRISIAGRWVLSVPGRSYPDRSPRPTRRMDPAIAAPPLKGSSFVSPFRSQ
ncbi:hypothetical protein BRC60_00035 [Halobacteriales archaeon QH_1_68_42]|nr:MAG: hypothetical protein BRC60_00035 [Halobacteriales archaeon QH_1_68_42]